MAGCSGAEEIPEFQPLLKHGDFYVAVNAEGKTYYVDYNDGILSIIGPGRTALDKYACAAPKLMASFFDAEQIIDAGKQQTSDTDGIALGNLYITNSEIITFSFADLTIMERHPTKKAGVTRIASYDDFVDKLDILYEAVSDASEYQITIDSKENPVLYRDDRIVYYDGGYVHLKNISGIYEDPVSYMAYYDQFVQTQGRIELLMRGNGLHDYFCIVFKESLCFISDAGHLTFTKEEY